MLKQAINNVKIEGILAEVDINEKPFTRNGKTIDALGGKIVVKGNQKIGQEDKDFMIEVHMFATPLKRDGNPNPAYESIKRVRDEFVSIAAAGNEDDADRIRITSGDIRMNEYYGADGRLISYPRINASFINRISKDACKPQATFEAQFVVASKAEEMDSEGNPTGRLLVKGILPQYGGKVDVFDFVAETPGVIDAISDYWEIDDTVKAGGRLDFSSKTEVVYEEAGFGEPIAKSRTINKSDLVITGGSENPYEGDAAYDHVEIRDALAERKARLESQKGASMSRTKQRKAPAAAHNDYKDLGF